MKLIFLTIFIISNLFSQYNYNNYGNIEILSPQNIKYLTEQNQQKLPIRFITDSEIEHKFGDRFKKRENFTSHQTYKEKNGDEVKKDWNMEFGIKFLNNLFLDISDNFSDITISRDIEFYSERFISPYFRFNFKDIYLVEKAKIVMRNSLETSYLSFDKQTPFFSDTGQYPYNRSYDVGTKIQSLSLFWKGSFLFKSHFFSGGIYIGTGLNILDGKASYLRYVPSDINGSLSQNMKPVSDGLILERGETIKLSTTSSILTKYGITLNMDFKPIHLAFGVDFGITSEKNLYWIERAYFMELSYMF